MVTHIRCQPGLPAATREAADAGEIRATSVTLWPGRLAMRVRVGTHVILVGIALACFASTVHGQEGHPLTGTWSGDWGPSGGDRRHLTVVMSWDGNDIRAVVNPGPDAVTITPVRLDVTSWTVRLEVERPAASGGPIVAEGRLEDLGSPHRRIRGTWREGPETGTFQLTRD